METVLQGVQTLYKTATGSQQAFNDLWFKKQKSNGTIFRGSDLSFTNLSKIIDVTETSPLNNTDRKPVMVYFDGISSLKGAYFTHLTCINQNPPMVFRECDMEGMIGLFLYYKDEKGKPRRGEEITNYLNGVDPTSLCSKNNNIDKAFFTIGQVNNFLNLNKNTLKTTNDFSIHSETPQDKDMLFKLTVRLIDSGTKALARSIPCTATELDDFNKLCSEILRANVKLREYFKENQFTEVLTNIIQKFNLDRPLTPVLQRKGSKDNLLQTQK